MDHLLYLITHASKEARNGQPAWAGAVTKAATDTGGHHMGHPDKVEHQGISRHSDPTLPIGPSDELVTLMLKYRGSEDTLLTIADRAGDHAVMAPDAC